jgi:hypothetical protein
MLRSMRDVSASMTVQIGARSTEISAGKGTFAQQITKILRTLCVMLQTLKPLPDKKHASMQVTYYDELTPSDYEPPGFVGTVFDVQYLFERPTLKHDFGVAESNHHRIGVGLETAVVAQDAVNEAESVPEQKADIIDTSPTLTISQAIGHKDLTLETIGTKSLMSNV